VKLDRKPLTRTQRKILWLMREHGEGPVMIAGGTRDFYWARPREDHPASLIIHAYMDPDLFLRRRGLIEEVQQNAPGRFYRLTDHGAARAAALVENPL
jgi:hypothetical protein